MSFFRDSKNGPVTLRVRRPAADSLLVRRDRSTRARSTDSAAEQMRALLATGRYTLGTCDPFPPMHRHVCRNTLVISHMAILTGGRAKEIK